MSPVPAALRRLGLTLEMIKFSHTLFALPFAATSALASARGLPTLRQGLGILAAMVGARSAAMAFNRVADLRYDRENPRTAGRHLPQGLLSARFALGFTVISSALFIGACAILGQTCLILSPVALGWVLGYSFSKRFTSASHLWLGIGLGMAPVGAWVAVRGGLSEAAPWWLGGGVALWTAGFDLLYACQDADFDRRAGLHAVPARWGIPAALRLSAALHLASTVMFWMFVRHAGLGPWSLAAVGATGLVLAVEHRLVRADDLSRLNTAFFTANAVVGLLIAAGVAMDVF